MFNVTQPFLVATKGIVGLIPVFYATGAQAGMLVLHFSTAPIGAYAFKAAWISSNGGMFFGSSLDHAYLILPSAPMTNAERFATP